MGRKIFVSYKYWDYDVYSVPKFSDDKPKVRDYVSWLEDKFRNRTEHYYKGESDNEDLSKYSEEYIWNKLKDKIYDSSLTIVLISPNMKELRRWEKSQWIPWEISYSLRKTHRGNTISQSNAVLGVILPDRKGDYDYYKNIKLFSILENNINNRRIPVVYWDNFKYNCDKYIEQAFIAKDNVSDWIVQINI